MVDAVSMLNLVSILFFVPLSAAAFEGSKSEPVANQHAQRKLSYENIIGPIFIDCGAASDNNIEFGVPMTISSEFYKHVNEVGRSLRSFPNGTRNCYTLHPEGAKINQTYLVRASFTYGNYDNLNNTPKFDLHIGVNKWATVNLGESSSYIYDEIIYVSSTLYVDVCLVNTDYGIPFISALELRGLDDSMYKFEPGLSLVWEARHDAGVLSSTAQAQDDYGRDWYPLPATPSSNWIPHNTSEPIQTQSESNLNEVPETVWKTAARGQNASVPLRYKTTFYDGSIKQFHLYFYFADIFQDVQPREMTIRLNRDPAVTTVTLTEYLTTVTVGPLQTNATSDLHFEIWPIMSGLAPIINAFEIFLLNELPNRPTNPEDVDAMTKIKKAFNVTKNWQSDPCVPRNLVWEGVTCNVDYPPRIISLNLSSSNLVGELPAWISNLTAIQSLDLSYNKLNGSLQYLAQLEELKVLNLSGNNFTGSVPPELADRFKYRPQLLRLDGNNLTFQGNVIECLSGACNKNNIKFLLPLVVAIVTFSILVIIVFSLVMFLRSKRQKSGSVRSKDRLFSYSKIVSITGNFKTIVGEGGFGKVYGGVLADQTPVAVKMLSKSSKQGSKEFRAEAQLLMVVHHRNLVSLVGYCEENEHMGLIYEYLPNGNLQQHLSDTKNNILNWRDRLQIAVSSAQGLEYLHNGCKPPIIHRDLKPANILLDENMQAKISDFGLSRAFSGETMSFTQTNPAGTLGYFDPEYQASGYLNKKSDVYSFGIILLELITGQRAIIRGFENNTHIVQWVKPIIQRGDIGDIVDPRLDGEFHSNAAWKALEVAMSCVQPTAIQRPDMNHVLVELKEALELEIQLGRSLSAESTKMKSTDYSMLMESVEFGEDSITPQAR